MVEDEKATERLCLVLRYKFPSGEFYGTKEEQEMLFRTEETMDRILIDAGIGDVDGNEVGGGGVAYYAFGSDAPQVWAALEAAARAVPFRPASVEIVMSEDERRTIKLD